MVKLKVVWSPTAVGQLQQIILFYNTRNNNTKYSQYIVRIIKESIIKTDFPFSLHVSSYFIAHYKMLSV